MPRSKPLGVSTWDADLALVNVSVTDPYDRAVTGLDSSSFRVFETNVEQEIVAFSSEDIPVASGVIFDNRGSVADKTKGRRGRYRFLEDLQSGR